MQLMNFTPPGPVASAFIDDRSAFSAIMGPMGSGKTSAVIFKTVRLVAEQRPSLITGERLFKLGVVRDTLANMKRTTMKSIESWFGESGQWGGGGSSAEPPFFKVGFKLPDGSVARLWYDFIGLDVHNIEQLAKGWEVTAYWLNEASLLNPDVKTFLDGRTGRYPGAIHGGPTWYGGLADYNAPDTENYLYDIMEVQKPEGHKLFRQPGGRSPHAENRANLPPGYYDRLIATAEDWWVRTNVDNEYGFSREGQPVYSTYSDNFHCGGTVLEPVPGILIKLYADAALHPAVVIVQFLGDGQMLVLDEIAIEGGAVQLGEAIRDHMATKYPGFAYAGGFFDPAAEKRGENDSDAENWGETLNRVLGLKGRAAFKPAPTNDLAKRLDAVKARLKKTVGAGQPALRLSARAVEARKGFNSTYRYRKRANGDKSDEPEKKHPVSDVHDAIQYACLDEGGYEEVSATEHRKNNAAAFGRMHVAKMKVRVNK